jgi:hypothetical protein
MRCPGCGVGISIDTNSLATPPRTFGELLRKFLRRLLLSSSASEITLDAPRQRDHDLGQPTGNAAIEISAANAFRATMRINDGLRTAARTSACRLALGAPADASLA